MTMPSPRLTVVLPSTFLLLVLVLLVQQASSSSSDYNSIKDFFSTRTATRIKSTAALFPFSKKAPAAAATTPPSPIYTLTDATYQETITSSSNSSATVTWIIHAYASFSPEATQLNKLLEGEVLSFSSSSAVRLGKVELTQERHLSQDLLGLQEEDFQSHLFVLRPVTRAGGERMVVPYHGARTRQALQKLVLGHQIPSATVPTPTHLNTPKEVLSFVKEHPLTFLLGRSIEESSNDNMAEELGFILTCQVNGWHHCGIVPSAEVLVQVAPAAFRGYRPGEVDVRSNAIMKFEGHGQESRLYPRGAPSFVSVREWMVQEGFPPLSQIDLEASHFRSFLFEQSNKQMLLGVINPLQESKEEIDNLMQILQKTAAHKNAENVVVAYVTEGEAWTKFSQGKAPPASSPFFLLDPATRGLYQAPAEASQLTAFLQQQEGAPLLVLSPPAPPKQEQQSKGRDTYSDSDNDTLNKKGFENLVLDALSSSIFAVLVVLFLFFSPQKWWGHEATTATTPKTIPTTPLSNGSDSNLPAQKVTEKQKQQQDSNSILLPESES